jgi:uncharacterized protein
LPNKLKYSVLPERLAVCRVPRESEVPAWSLTGEFFSVVRTHDDLSIVCAESLVPQNDAGVAVERGWVALKLEGPFPFAMTGVLASFVQPLAEAEIPIFAVSTFDTDYVLVKSENLEPALRALGAAGHRRTGKGNSQNLAGS